MPIQLSAPNAPTLARPTPISKVPARFSPGAIAPSSESAESVSPLVPVPPKPAAPKPAAPKPAPAQPAHHLEPRSNLLIALLLLILVVSVWLVVRLGVPLFEELRHGRQDGATRTAESSTNVAPQASSPGTPEKAPSKPATTAPVDAVSGVLRVESDIPATAQVDGKPIGPTPIRELVLPQGAHRVEVVFSDGRTQVANTQITAGRATTIRFTVKKPE